MARPTFERDKRDKRDNADQPVADCRGQDRERDKRDTNATTETPSEQASSENVADVADVADGNEKHDATSNNGHQPCPFYVDEMPSDMARRHAEGQCDRDHCVAAANGATRTVGEEQRSTDNS